MDKLSGKTKRKVTSQGERNSNNGTLPKLIFDNETLDILHANNEFAEILGYTIEELSALSISHLITDDFSSLIDNENVTFPAYKIVRQFLCKNGKIINCLSENCEVDFDCSALIIYYTKTDINSKVSIAFTPDILVDNVYASKAFDHNFSII